MVNTQLKKVFVHIAFLFSSLFSLIPVVSAQTFTGDIGNIGDALMRLFGPIFGANLLESSNFAFWAKFLIWILLFALFFWVFSMVFRERKNIAVTVALIIAAISVLGLPESWLRGIVESYSFFSAFILYVAPIVGVLYLMHRFFGEDNRFNHIMKAVLFFLLAALLTHFTAAMQNAGGIQSFNFATGIASLAVSVCILAGLYQIIRAIFAGPAGAAGAIPAWPGGGPIPPHPGPVQPPPDFTANLNALQNAITQYNNIRETRLRVPAMRDLLNANHARHHGGGGAYPYPTPAPTNWGAYTVAWNALVGQDVHIRALIRNLQRHPDFARITPAQATQFDTLVATNYSNALIDTTTLLNDFAFHLGHNNASPW